VIIESAPKTYKTKMILLATFFIFSIHWCSGRF